MAKNYGDDLLVSTSVHMRVGTMKQLRELFPRSGSSKFIREAVEEKLQREGGLRSTVERLKGERLALGGRMNSLDIQIERLERESVRFDALNLENQRRRHVEDALKNVSYASPEDLFKDLVPLMKIQDKKDEIFVKALIDEEWAKHANVQERRTDNATSAANETS